MGFNWDLTIRLHSSGILQIAVVVLCVLAGHTHAIQSVALTPDGKCAVTGSEDNTVRFWDLANVSSSPHILLGYSDVIWSVALTPVALTPNGKWALTGSSDTTARLWNLANIGCGPRVLSGHTAWNVTVALTPDGKWALTGSR